MRPSPRKLAWLLIPILSSCVTADFIQTVPTSLPPRDPSTVGVYRSGPQRPAHEIGWIRVTSGEGYRAALHELVRKAAEHGCDAVADIRSNQSEASYNDLATTEEMTGSCLVYASPERPPAPAGGGQEPHEQWGH